jgi:hypothetical protein
MQTLKNLKMNNETYALRSKVMELIYEAKALVPSLPRITLRITENSDRVNGVAQLNDNLIWIPANSPRRSKDQLRRTVFHGILHAAYGVEHVASCKLMGSVYTDITKSEAEKLFKKYAR